MNKNNFVPAVSAVISVGFIWLLSGLNNHGEATTPAVEPSLDTSENLGFTESAAQKKLLAPDGTADDLFGGEVAISGNFAIAGASWDDHKGNNSGSAYIFYRHKGGVNNWGKQRKLLAPDGAADDHFGGAVAISGDYAIVGAAVNDDKGDRSGSAYIFHRNRGGSNKWGKLRKLLAPDGAAEDLFGTSVFIFGDHAIVGASGNDDKGSRSGSAYIYYRNKGGANKWGLQRKLLAPDGAEDDFFGQAVFISNNFAIVGASGDDHKGSNSGSAYVFHRNRGGPDNWGKRKKLLAPDGAADDHFGQSVFISGSYAIVGARGNDDKGSGSGSAYIFFRNEGGTNNWGKQKKLLAPDGAEGDSLGERVGIYGDYAIAGAYANEDQGDYTGSAYIFYRNKGGANNWGKIRKLLAPDAAMGDEFGTSVGIWRAHAIVGAWGDDDKGAESGSAYVFTGFVQ